MKHTRNYHLADDLKNIQCTPYLVQILGLDKNKFDSLVKIHKNIKKTIQNILCKSVTTLFTLSHPLFCQIYKTHFALCKPGCWQFHHFCNFVCNSCTAFSGPMQETYQISVIPSYGWFIKFLSRYNQFGLLVTSSAFLKQLTACIAWCIAMSHSSHATPGPYKLYMLWCYPRNMRNCAK